VFICFEKCKASSLTSPERGVSRSKEKEKREILRVYSLPRGPDGDSKNECCCRNWVKGLLAIGGNVRQKKRASSPYSCMRTEAVGNKPKRTMPQILANMRLLNTSLGIKRELPRIMINLPA
jgi:hypothetical protein